MASRTSLAFVSLLFTCGCFSAAQGTPPPTDELYFPVGVALSSSREHLFVASSNFDLKYTGGVVQSLDLRIIRDDLVPEALGERGEPCGKLGERSVVARYNAPLRCEPAALAGDERAPSLITSSVKIGAFATDVIFRERPTDAGAGRGRGDGRLFVPVRGDATLHWLDADGEGKLECGQDANGGRCSDRYRAGDDPDIENTRDVRMPPEPFSIDATPNGEAVVVTHQTEGAASLFVNEWSDRGPHLEFVERDLPTRAVAVSALPVPKAAEPLMGEGLYAPGFLLTFRDSAEVRLLRYYRDRSEGQASNPARPFLDDLGSSTISTNSLGYDSRGLAVADAERRACEAKCGDDAACLLSCARDVPVTVYVTNRSPNSLILGRTRPGEGSVPTDELPFFYDMLPLPFGASRVIVGDVLDTQGRAVPRVFVVCFDQRKVAIIDPATRQIEKFVDTGRGPYALAIDVKADAYGFAYLAHFTDSWIGVMDLDQRRPATYGTLVLGIGQPQKPRGSE
jgi:hypothetical protein